MFCVNLCVIGVTARCWMIAAAVAADGGDD